MIPSEAREIFLYYGAAIFLGIILFFRRGRARRGMRLRLRGGATPPHKIQENLNQKLVEMSGPSEFSRIQPQNERPLNVIFNFNGESWDAYEVLGLPAGSAPDKVDEAYRDGIAKMDEGSRAFLQAAYQAIQTQWKIYRASS